jgi:hypothetical protein
MRAMKTLGAAILAAGVMPTFAGATTVMSDGGVYDLSSDNEFDFADSTLNDGGDNYFTFGFASGGLPSATAFNLIFDPVDTNLDTFTASWSTGANGTGTVFNTETVDASSGVATILDFAASFADSDPQWLSVTWTTVSGGPANAEVDIEVSPAGVAPVPVPAAGLLLLGGLGGLAAMKRRRKSA